MALVIETGSGLANADAYVTIAEVDSYNTDFVGDSVWDALSDVAVQERHIREACQYLDTFYNLKWVGRKGSLTQSMLWPRVSAIDKDQYLRPADEIPLEVVRSCKMLTILASNEDLVPNIAAGSSSGLIYERKKIGKLEKEQRWSSATTGISIWRDVDLLLKPLLKGHTLERG